MEEKDKISLIIPCLNEEEAIPLFYKEIVKVNKEIKTVDFEIIFVDDGSQDKTLDVLRKLSKKDKRVYYRSFSRNFGKEAAMLAGLEKASGKYITFMDVDLQDPPYLLKEMYEVLQTGEYDCVALYTNSHEGYSFLRKGLTNMWYKLTNKLAKSKQKPGARDFRLMTRQMVDSLLSMKEYSRYMKGMFDYVGYRTKWLSYEAPERLVGDSKFNLKKLLKYALEGITSTSTAPLTFSIGVGFLFLFASFILIIGMISQTIGENAINNTFLFLFFLITSALQLIFLGIIGTYISKIFLEVKNRPAYFIKEESN